MALSCTRRRFSRTTRRSQARSLLKIDTSFKAGNLNIGKECGPLLQFLTVRTLYPSGWFKKLSVTSGHAGEEVSEHLSKTFPGHLRYALELLLSRNPLASSQDISDMLTRGFEAFDNSIIDDLFNLLPTDYEKLSEEELKKLINDQESGGKVYNACIRCMRGSTAIVVLLNPEKSHIWVANLGDCQASGWIYFIFFTVLFEHGQCSTR